MDLQGKVAVVTGAGTGIGRSIAVRFARAGAGIVVNYSRSESEARETLAQVEESGVPALLYQADVSDDQAVRAMLAAATERLGRVDVLVNNAGTTNFVAHDDLEGLTEEFWDRAMAVNVKGLFFCSRAATAELRRNHGAIINITSVAGLNGSGSSIAYAASKAAAISVTKSLARVLAPEVRVNAIAPGIVMTRWVAGREEHVLKYAQGTPLGRPATPDDVADVAYALATGGDFITGETIVVDGGIMLH